MNDKSNPQSPTTGHKSERANADNRRDQNDQRDNTQKPGNGENAHGQDRSSQTAGRPGNDRPTKSADPKGAQAARSGEDRRQERSSDGTNTEFPKGWTGVNTKRAGATDTSESGVDIDLDEKASESAGNKQSKADAAQEPTADSSKISKHGNNSTRSDSNRDERRRANPSQSGRNN